MKNKRYSKTISCEVYDTDFLFVIEERRAKRRKGKE